MLEELHKKLVDVFGERVAFNQLERMLYSSDLSNLPDIVRKQLNTIPDAVVQPDSGEDLIALMNMALKYKTPLIPRGAGTAGFGGAVPTGGGIVVDFYRLRRVVDVNREKRSVTVEPGVVWDVLEAELRNHGLSLRLYPGSAISATVGGWIANGGGVGIGSYEYGYLRDNILEVEIITPQGTKRLSGDEIDFVYGMAGTTGLISEVILAVRDGDDDVPVLGAFDSMDDLQHAFQEIKENKLPLWEVSYKDPLHVEMSSKAVETQAEFAGACYNSMEPKLPEAKWIATFVYPSHRDAEVKDKLYGIVRAHRGEILGERLARIEWDERFYPMRLKSLGPSLVPSEFIIPMDRLSKLTNRVSRRINGVMFNGTLINHGSETVVMVYTLDDERRRGFPLSFATSFIPLEIAKRLQGRAYVIGMFFTEEAERLFGANKLLNINKFKNEVDHEHIMNPGKVFPNSATKNLRRMLKLASRTTTVLKAGDKLLGGKSIGKVANPKTTIGKLPYGQEAVWDAFACANCGYCRTVCPKFKAIGWESASPRGKYHFLREYIKGNAKLDERMAEMFFACTTCRQCNEICQVKAHIEEDWTLTARPTILRKGFYPPVVFQRQAHNILLNHNPSGADQAKRKAWMTPDLQYRDEGEIGYWAGCAVSYDYRLRNIPINAFRILNKAGIKPVYLGIDEWCCGGALFTVGCIEEVQELVRHNLDELHKRGIKTLVTSCSGCWLHLAHFYPLLAKSLNTEFNISVKHITEVLKDLLQQGKIECQLPIELKVTYHDSCHNGRGGGIFEPPREIIAAIPGLELTEMPRNREHSACCGRHVVRYPRLGKIINTDRITEAARTSTSAIVCSCPTCENNFRIGKAAIGANLEVIDISDLVAESMGLPILAVSRLAKLLPNKL